MRYSLHRDDVVSAMEKTNFRDADLYPRSGNCTAIAVGVVRVLPNDRASIVSVYDVDGLVHSAVYYDNYLIDSNGKIGEGIETFVSDYWTTDFTMADVESALSPCNSVEEFILSNYIEEYNDGSEIPKHNTQVANKAEELFVSSLEQTIF